MLKNGTKNSRKKNWARKNGLGNVEKKNWSKTLKRKIAVNSIEKKIWL
jgi:hypothetical protein